MPSRSCRSGPRTSSRLAAVILAGAAAIAAPSAAAADTSTPPPTSSTLPPTTTASQCAAPATTIVSGVPWAQQRLAPERAWPLTKGQGMVVGVVDTGVDGSVPQLTGAVLPGKDIAAGQAANTDCAGHGTFVAGIVAARPATGVGFAGVAPGATILPVRQAGTDGNGTSSGMADAIRYAVDAGAKLINVSSSAISPSDQLAAAVTYANDHDVLIVAAVANDAQQGNPRTYPAAYPGVIAVAAVDQKGSRSSFSETGDFVDLAAPGSNIVSLGTGGPGQLIGEGTSYAAPFVTGVAALVWSYRPGLSAAQVKHRLEVTADHPAKVTLPDSQLGWGVVNPYEAVARYLPEEQGAAAVTAPAQPARISVQPGRAAATDQDTAVLIAFALLGVIALAALAVVVLPRGHRRRWRAGRVRT